MSLSIVILSNKGVRAFFRKIKFALTFLLAVYYN